MGAHNNVNHTPDDQSSDTVAKPALGVQLGDLIAQAREGSASALGQLLEHCRRYLLLVANESLDSDLRPKGAASDLVQDTFLAAQRGFPQFRGTTEQELLAWLAKILTNRVANHVRQYRFTQRRELDREIPIGIAHANGQLNVYSSAEPIDAAIAGDDAEQLRAALARLPNHWREVLILRTWERHSFAEIAIQLQTTPGAVRKIWARALQSLQQELR